MSKSLYVHLKMLHIGCYIDINIADEQLLNRCLREQTTTYQNRKIPTFLTCRMAVAPRSTKQSPIFQDSTRFECLSITPPLYNRTRPTFQDGKVPMC
jgi:hypothetical protein